MRVTYPVLLLSKEEQKQVQTTALLPPLPDAQEQPWSPALAREEPRSPPRGGQGWPRAGRSRQQRFFVWLQQRSLGLALPQPGYRIHGQGAAAGVGDRRGRDVRKCFIFETRTDGCDQYGHWHCLVSTSLRTEMPRSVTVGMFRTT